MASVYLEEEDLIAEAVELIETLETRPQLAHVAWLFSVPYQRLRRRLQGLPSKSTRNPTNRKLTDEQEEALESYLRRCDRIGAAARVRMVAISANSILARYHTNTAVPPPKIGSHWASRYLERNPHWHRRRQ